MNIKRQQIRKALIIISLMLFPVTLYYFSPALIIQGAAVGIITGCFILFGLMLLTSIFAGRAFCGWLCPAGGLQETCFAANNQKTKGGKLDWIKYVIWVPWITLIAIFFIKAGGFLSVQPFYETNHGISVVDIKSYIIYYGVVALILILALSAGRRAFCHYVCWMAPFMIIGSKIRNALNIPSLRLKTIQTSCVGCSKCSQVCPMSLPVLEMVQKKGMEHTECILCGSCVDNCPQKALHLSLGKVDK